ncbi:UNVERIFIED_CONTAM: Retrovirus-related Pol polyprotein from transposon [Sesamum radiatum]|uniref:Retrovirus-related Pol polyprotein from transposon n=1 Tax=Sesamum radiatum TaxID=300843 RepID=A0AAW2T672_SESRA
MAKLITDMLQQDKKKDDTWHFYIDYRGLNAITVKDHFPIPTVDELLDELHGATIFSKIDLRAGYHQIQVPPVHVHKMGFRTVDGYFEFLVMPFGLTNAPSTFQAVMNDLFWPFLRRFVLVFFDDILFYSPSWLSHLSHLTQVLQVLQDNCLFAKLRKFVFGAVYVDYLGHVILGSGVAANPSLTGYYRKFVHHYAAIASPLTDLLKGREFIWTPAASTVFENLKRAMTSLPILRLSGFSLPFDITTDASQSAIDAVFSQ